MTPSSPPPRLASLPLAALAALLLALPAAAAAYDPFEDPPPPEETHSRLALTAWGGQYVGVNGSSRPSAGLFAGEVTWRFDGIDLGLLAEGTKLQVGSSSLSPVILARLTERFETRRGLDAMLTLGIGAARETTKWKPWFQVAIGVQLDLGPLFLAAELGFEQQDLTRFAGGLGTRF